MTRKKIISKQNAKRFDNCKICSQIPHFLFKWFNSEEEVTKDLRLRDLNISTGHAKIYKCPWCGTYYFSQKDIDRSRFFRATHVHANCLMDYWSKFDKKPWKEFEWNKKNYRKRISEVKKMLNKAGETARFAGETLADDFKLQKRSDKVAELLKHPNPEVRLGVLRSFAEIPWYDYASIPKHCLSEYTNSCKPFMNLYSIHSKLVARLCDPDIRIREYASSLLNSYDPWKEDFLVKKLLLVPVKKRSIELKQLHIARISPFKPNGVKELADYLKDPDAQIRQSALMRIYEYSTEGSSYVKVFQEVIGKLYAESPTEQMKHYLDYPEASSSSDNDYDPYD